VGGKKRRLRLRLLLLLRQLLRLALPAAVLSMMVPFQSLI
jgi:hypothetical protein